MRRAKYIKLIIHHQRERLPHVGIDTPMVNFQWNHRLLCKDLPNRVHLLPLVSCALLSSSPQRPG